MSKTCQCCNYTTTDASNYKKHLKTKKHLDRTKTLGDDATIQEKYDALLLEHEALKAKYALVNPVKEEDVEIVEVKPVILPKSFCCVACQYTTARKYNLDLHNETGRHRKKISGPDFYDGDVSLVTTDLKKECIDVGSCAPLLVAIHFKTDFPTMRFSESGTLEVKWSRTWKEATSARLENIVFEQYDGIVREGFKSRVDKCLSYLKRFRCDLNTQSHD